MPKRTHQGVDVDEKKERDKKKFEELKDKVSKEFVKFQQEIVSSVEPSFLKKHKINGIEQPDLSPEEGVILMDIFQKKDGATATAFLLYWGLPSSTTSTDHFIMTLLGLDINWKVVQKFKSEVLTVNGISTFYTPFKGHKMWSKKAEVLDQLGFITKEQINLVKTILSSRDEVKVNHDQTKKENLVLSSIPASNSLFLIVVIEEFRQRMLKSKELPDEMAWNYFILKCLVGARTEQLYMVKLDDIFFKEGQVMVAYTNSVKGQKDQVIFHTFLSNPSQGPHRLFYDVPTLFRRQIEIATDICRNEINPFLFPFFVNVHGVSLGKPAATFNNMINKKFPFNAHATRDVCVLLCKASGLSDDETKKYLTHSEKSTTMVEHYMQLARQYLSYRDDELTQKGFGSLTDNITMLPITVEKDNQGPDSILLKEHIRNKEFDLSNRIPPTIRNEDPNLIAFLNHPDRLNRTLVLASLFQSNDLDQQYQQPTVTTINEAIQIFKINKVLYMSVLPMLLILQKEIKTKKQLLEVLNEMDDYKLILDVDDIDDI